MECNIKPQKLLEFIDAVKYKNTYLYYSVLRTCAVMNMCFYGDVSTGFAFHIRTL